MSNLWRTFWNDECGAIVTAEAGLLATLGVMGALVGARTLARSVDAELREMAEAFRSLDQSYSYRGFCSPQAATAGSCYRQPPVKESLKKLRRFARELEKKAPPAEEKPRKDKRNTIDVRGSE